MTKILNFHCFYLTLFSGFIKIGHQGHAIRDRNNLKSRYPQLISALSHYQLLRRLPTYFQNVYKSKYITVPFI